VVHQADDKSEIYVCLFTTPLEAQGKTGLTSTPGSAPASTSSEVTQTQPAIVSKTHLEQELLLILKGLAAKSGNKSVPIVELHKHFQQRQGQPIKQVLQRLNIKLRYVTFLESCSAFKLEKNEKNWLISLAKL
jgi:hypothetical protein